MMNLNEFIKKEIKKIQKDKSLKYSVISEENNNSEEKPYNKSSYEEYDKDLESVINNLGDLSNKLETILIKQEKKIQSLPDVQEIKNKAIEKKDIITNLYKNIKSSKISAEKSLYF